MKVKVLSRNQDDYQRETKKDIHKCRSFIWKKAYIFKVSQICQIFHFFLKKFLLKLYISQNSDKNISVVRNYNAPEDPFQAQTEYTRALNATKLERVYAKPFVASLDGHLEGVHILAKHYSRLTQITVMSYNFFF